MSFLDDLLGKQIKKDGVILPQRKTLNIIGTAAVSVDDNTSTGETDLTIDTAAIADGTVTKAKLVDSAAVSVLGRSANSVGVLADIVASTNGFVLRRLADAISWGRILTSMIVGTTTNDSAATGDVGEYVSSSIAFGAATSLTSATPKTITSISLTAGDWDVSGVGCFTGSPSGASERYQIATISTTNNALGAQESNAAEVVNQSGSNFSFLPTPTVRISIASTTTVYLTAAAIFGGGTMSGYGTLRARRMR